MHSVNLFYHVYLSHYAVAQINYDVSTSSAMIPRSHDEFTIESSVAANAKLMDSLWQAHELLFRSSNAPLKELKCTVEWLKYAVHESFSLLPNSFVFQRTVARIANQPQLNLNSPSELTEVAKKITFKNYSAI